MAQVTLYLDAETAAMVRRSARAAGLSQSRWLAQLIRERAGSQWPAEVRELAGAWVDCPTAEEIRSSLPPDVDLEDLPHATCSTSAT